MGKLYNIQVLRGLAALMVVIGHLSVPIPLVNRFDGDVFDHGAAGVDIFFIISGFIMVYTTDAGTYSPARFMRSRALRIIPLYWMITLFIFGSAVLVPKIFPQVSTEISHLFYSLAFLPEGRAPVVYVGWSLNYEVFFYILFAIGLGIGSGWRIIFPLCFIVIASALSFTSAGGAWWTFLTNPLSLEFCAGMLLGCAWKRLVVDWRLAAAAFAIAMIAIFVGPYPLDGDERIVRVLVWGIPALFIVGSALALEAQKFELRNPLLQEIGNASYSIYLTHFFVTRAYEKFPIGIKLEDYPVAAVAVSVVVIGVVIAVGIGVHRLIELPLNRAFDRILPKVPKRQNPDASAEQAIGLT